MLCIVFKCTWDGSSCSKAYDRIKTEKSWNYSQWWFAFPVQFVWTQIPGDEKFKFTQKKDILASNHMFVILVKKHSEERLFVIHTSVHSGEKSFFCATCGTIYTQQNLAIEHIKWVHVGEYQFSCKDCDKSFFSPQQLKIHRRVHNGENHMNAMSEKENYWDPITWKSTSNDFILLTKPSKKLNPQLKVLKYLTIWVLNVNIDYEDLKLGGV